MLLNYFQTTAKLYLFALLTDWDLILAQMKFAILIFVLWAYEWREDDYIIGQNMQPHFMIYNVKFYCIVIEYYIIILLYYNI